MPAIQPVKISLKAPDGRATHADAETRVWEKKDATRKAVQWGSAVAAVGILMVPIPGVHFFSPFVLLIGAPLAAFLIFRLYSSGTDLTGRAACPSCGATVDVNGTADRWPITRVCPACRTSFSIDRI